MGHTEEAPYDAIHVGAAAPTVPQAVSFCDQGHIVPIHFEKRNEYRRSNWMQFCVSNRIKMVILECLFKTITYLVSLPASWPVEAWRPADSSRWPGGGKPDAGAVRQNGGRQHQNEALDGGDLCAFNRQRQAVVQVEVTSFSPSSPSLLLTVAKVKWCGLEQAMDHKGLHFAACWHFLLLPYHTS